MTGGTPSPSGIATDAPVRIPAPSWVISDTHLGHASILDYCPWRKTWAETVEAHDAALIAAWRATVKPDEWVLHLGDFALGSKDRLPHLRQQLPGRIVLVHGNHDRSASSLRAAGFDLVCSAVEIIAGADRWFGRHNPAAFSIREAAQASRLLHGHSHGNGYADTIHASIVRNALDCSLDALRSIAPVPWSTISGRVPAV